jgi:hypothetical protein
MAVEMTPAVVLVSDEQERLARFYADLIGGDVQPSPGSQTIDVLGPRGVCVTVRRDDEAIPTSWPPPSESQPIRLLIYVSAKDLDEAERDAVSHGATPLKAVDVAADAEARRFADPAGNPFVIAARKEASPPS